MKPVDAATIRRVRAQLVGDPDLAGRSLGRRLSQQTDSWFESLGATLPAGWALAATGGYARGVLAPGSDIDVVLLHPPKIPDAAVRSVAEGLWYPMWDAGLKLSPAAHSTKSLLQLAFDDLDTATTVLAPRCLAGDRELVAEVQRGALEQWRKRPFVWLQRLLESGQQRWARLGDVAALLEPDLKDGRGGLRDHDMIRWALRVDRPDVSAALEGPVEDLAGPADLLLAVRCELHRATGRPVNVLLLQDQDRVAEAMGFADADALMLTISGAAHAIEWATDRFWWRVERLIRAGGRAKTSHITDLAPGVVLIDDEAHVAPDADVDEQSYVFRFAAAAAHAGRPMSGRALRTLASRGTPPGDDWSGSTRRAFVSLLGSGAWLAPTVEALERYALFSRFLPEWRAVRSLPQRNAFHTYTVDHHLLQTIANAGEFVRDVSRPDLLLLGALMHDLGKGYPGDHTDAGVDLVDTVVGRMGFPPDDIEVIRALVQHHLLLPETATRRDLEDPRTAANVAAAVGDVETLQLLAALTEADSRATGPAAWSEWKKSLIGELVTLTSGALAGRGAPPRRSAPADHMTRLAGLITNGEVHIEHDALADVDLLRIASRDRAGLFARIAGVLASHGLDIVGAAASTSPATDAAAGVAVDEFRIARVPGITPSWAKVEHDLRAALSGDLDVDARLEQRLRNRGRRRAVSAEPPKLEVLVSNDDSDSTTVVEVRAPDAPAVLYRVAHALSDHGLDIRSAVVATLGHEVVDVFYVRSPASPNGQVPSDAFDSVRASVRAALT
ncbi:MAG TPA: [protein-PII] uridylyltransferase [Ilumatobacteraceae bacterium]|nr:[protein-PII] uridylyltransferase [Ilumatobacteraceae bacterium]